MTILGVLCGAAKQVFGRLLDAVDPELVAVAERTLENTPGVHGVGRLRLRWVGHSLTADADLDVAHDLSLMRAHQIAHDAEHRLMHALPRLGGATIHPNPAGQHGRAGHDLLAHHQR